MVGLVGGFGLLGLLRVVQEMDICMYVCMYVFVCDV